LFFFSLNAAFILSLIDVIFFIGYFVTYHDWLDRLYPKAVSHNVIGSIEPKGTVKRTIVFSGHMDTTKEFQWWYKLRHPGMVLSVFSGLLLVFWPLYLLVFTLVGGIGMLKWGWWFFAITSPATLTMYFIHGRDYIMGAQDNLSGITLAMALGEHFSLPENRLQNTRIKVASFGSEEPGLLGAKAYCETYYDELVMENAVNINMDGIKDADQLHIITREMMVLVKYTKGLVNELKTAFENEEVPYRAVPLTVGATDSAAFIRRGLPAVAIVGQSLTKLDPTYHTRLDIPECVDEAALEEVKRALVRFVIDSDHKFL